MPLRVRVRNFQSIEDATVVIDGFVVITGPNNSGKSAFMRAIRGVFTNSPAGSLLRNGTDFLSVELEFDDGIHILWEKGWEKPGQKGKAVNRYTLNGVVLNSVGRGVPPEIESLGVRQISAASDKIWPQIADQFDGTLFLVNRPGSAVAEALSDVSRVGKLTSALRLSEKDRRSANSELQVRRRDVLSLQDEVARFDGLGGVRIQTDTLGEGLRSLKIQGQELQETVSLRDLLEEASGRVSALSGFNPDVVPPASTAQELSGMSSRLGTLRDLGTRLRGATEEAQGLADFQVVVPDPARATRLGEAVRRCVSLRAALSRARDEVEALAGAPLLDLPNKAACVGLQTQLREARLWKERLDTAQREPVKLADLLKAAAEKSVAAEAAVQSLLGERGLCPTCGTVCESTHGA